MEFTEELRPLPSLFISCSFW